MEGVPSNHQTWEHTLSSGNRKNRILEPCLQVFKSIKISTDYFGTHNIESGMAYRVSCLSSMLPFVLATVVVVAFVQLFCLVLCVVYRHSKFNSRPPLVGVYVCVFVDVTACKICSCLQHTPNTPQAHTHSTQRELPLPLRLHANLLLVTNKPTGQMAQPDSRTTGHLAATFISIAITIAAAFSLLGSVPIPFPAVAVSQAGSHRFQCPLCLHLVRPMKPHECKTMTFNASCKAINLRYLRLWGAEPSLCIGKHISHTYRCMCNECFYVVSM